MTNPELARDYVTRAGVRLRAIDVLFDAGCWAAVVGEFQEVVELTPKGLLRASGVAPPRTTTFRSFCPLNTSGWRRASATLASGSPRSRRSFAATTSWRSTGPRI